MLPKKRQRSPMGVKETVEKVWPRHRRWVKSHGCCVPGCTNTPVDFAHVKSRGAGGTDLFAVSLCRQHHSEQHTIGVATFGKKYGIDLWALAREFSRNSTEPRVREAMKLIALELAANPQREEGRDAGR